MYPNIVSPVGYLQTPEVYTSAHILVSRWARSRTQLRYCACPPHLHYKYRLSCRQCRHTSPGKSPTSLFLSSAPRTLMNTTRFAIAPLSAATGYLPAVTISLCTSASNPIGNIIYLSPTSSDPRLCPPGSRLFAQSSWSPCTTGDHTIMSRRVSKSPQRSLCTNLGVNSPTWRR